MALYLNLMTEDAPPRDYEHLLETMICLYFLAFVILMAKPMVETMLIIHNS